MIVRLLLCCVGLLTLLATATPARAQVTPPDTVTVVADTIPRDFPRPRNAFLRGLVVPGWGHLYIGAPRRGAVYFTLQSTSWFMLFKTLGRLDDARGAERSLARAGSDSLRAAMAADSALNEQLSDPVAFDAALAQYPGLETARSLVASRTRHRQDWIVYTIFFTFVGAADAYVAAHLADFPADVTISPARDGGLTLGATLPVGRRP